MGAVNVTGNIAGDALYRFTFPSGEVSFQLSTCNAGTTYDSFLRVYDDESTFTAPVLCSSGLFSSLGDSFVCALYVPYVGSLFPSCVLFVIVGVVGSVLCWR